MTVGYAQGSGDGQPIEGEADLSDIAGRGVFARWTEHPEEGDQVNIDALTGAPCWPGDLDVAPDALYQDIAKPEGSAAAAKRHIPESLSPE